uniref:Uncharacterized protein n=1 Tax=viral metagenome TaxID=1070528 RepID=A0A6C0J8J3_9ZZZZ
MNLSFKFFDKEEWSVYGTLNTIIILILLKLFNQQYNYQTLIFSSLIGMMDSDLLPKILFTGFLNFLVMDCTEEWIYKSLIYIFGVIITHQIKYNNYIHKSFTKNKLLLYTFRITVIIFMIHLFVLLYDKYLCIPYK